MRCSHCSLPLRSVAIPALVNGPKITSGQRCDNCNILWIALTDNVLLNFGKKPQDKPLGEWLEIELAKL